MYVGENNVKLNIFNMDIVYRIKLYILFVDLINVLTCYWFIGYTGNIILLCIIVHYNSIVKNLSLNEDNILEYTLNCSKTKRFFI